MVYANSSCLVGHVTFFISFFTSRKNRAKPLALFKFVVVCGTAIFFHIPAYQQISTSNKETKLFGFFMQSMFFAEFAIFIDFDTIWIVLFVFCSLVVTLFALSTSQSNAIACSNSHSSTPHLQLNIYHPKLLPI